MSIDKEVIIDLSYLKDVASDNIEFMVEMIDIFLEQTPGYIDSLTEAVDQKNWKRIAEMAHKIKPTLAFMGVDSAKSVMQSIEIRARNEEDYEGIVADYTEMKEVFGTIFIKLEEKKKELLANG